MNSLHQRIRMWVNEDTSRITATAAAYFNAIPEQKLEQTQSNYPLTVHALFDAALHVIDGKWGPALHDRFSISSEKISPPRTVLALLLVDLSHFAGALPEIFQPFVEDPAWDRLKQSLKELSDTDTYQLIFSENHPLVDPWIERVKIDPDHLKALMQMFDHFIDNLNNPASPLIHLFLENNLKDRAIHAALTMRQPKEKTKSLIELLNLFLMENNFPKAIEIWSQIPLPAEKHSMAIHLIDRMMERELTEQALGFVSNHPKHHERDVLTKEIALALSAKGEVDKALDLVRTIEDKEIHFYTLSRMVRALALQNKIHRAKEIALSILDEEYKQDAIVEIVKAYLKRRKVDEAIHFVETLEKGEKKKPAQVIEAALKARDQDEKVQSLRHLFSLYQVWQYAMRHESPLV